MKVSELTGAELDYWVAKELGHTVALSSEMVPPVVAMVRTSLEEGFKVFAPSTQWSDGGPIIEREQISVTCTLNCPTVWRATHRNIRGNYKGETPLIAAMRAFVASKFGEEVND